MNPRTQRGKQHFTYRMQTTAVTLNLICSWYDMWWLFKGNATRTTLIEGMNHYPTLFNYNAEAQFRSLLATVFTLYDGGKGRLTLKSLLDDANVPTSQARRLKKVLEAGDVIANQIKTIRHNLIAHRSDKHTYGDAFLEAGLTANKISRIITISCAVYNDIARACRAPRFYRVHHARSEMISLIEHIKK